MDPNKNEKKHDRIPSVRFDDMSQTFHTILEIIKRLEPGSTLTITFPEQDSAKQKKEESS